MHAEQFIKNARTYLQEINAVLIEIPAKNGDTARRALDLAKRYAGQGAAIVELYRGEAPHGHKNTHYVFGTDNRIDFNNGTLKRLLLNEPRPLDTLANQIRKQGEITREKWGNPGNT